MRLNKKLAGVDTIDALVSYFKQADVRFSEAELSDVFESSSTLPFLTAVLKTMPGNKVSI